MPSSLDFVQFVCDQIEGVGFVRYRKMFGEYMLYLNDKPIFMIIDDTVFVEINDETTKLLSDCETAIPYKNLKERYIFDIENRELAQEVAILLNEITPTIYEKKMKKLKRAGK